ncbi:MAG: CDP-alcohol phosphatidyltransferase family protein [Chloroflexi bacterium]|nr:CDP-alcohol phosphatidyltransferase family protein [Chloroflexota bacterium]
MSVPIGTPGKLADFLARAREFRRRYQGPEGLFWIRRVNHPMGAMLALPLLPTRVTPNAVTVAGLLVHLLGALIVALASPPASLLVMLAVLIIWQLAFSLDCADGQLARARGQASAFGAWFDQLVDVVSHAAVYTSLSLFLVRALDPDAGTAVVVAATAITLSLLQTFSTWQRAELIGRERPVGERPSPQLLLLYASRHLLDYGWFLFAASVLLLWPPGLFAFLIFSGLLQGLYVAAQILLSWRGRDTNGSRAGE